MKQVVARVAHEIPDRAPLRIAPGDEVTVGERDTGWLWCRSATSREGWVPVKTVETHG